VSDGSPRRGWGFFHPGDGARWGLVLLGLLLDALAIPPGPLPVAILVADTPFLLLLFRDGGARWKRWAYLYGTLHYGLALHWLWTVMPAQPFVVAAFLGVVWLAYAGLVRLGTRWRVPWLLVVPTAVVFAEWARTVYFGGMPWPTRSMSFTGSPTYVAASRLFGAYGLSFLAGMTSALAAGLPAVLRRHVPAARLARAALLPLGFAALLGMVGCSALSRWRDERGPGGEIARTSQTFVSIQAAIPQSLKNSPGAGGRREMFDSHLDLSAAALEHQAQAGRDVLAVLWPETMIPWAFVAPDLAARFPKVWESEMNVLGHVRNVPDAGHDPLWLLGAIYQFRRGDEVHDDLEAYGSYDSLFVLDTAWLPPPERGTPEPRPDVHPWPPWFVARHDKVVRVPGGEYAPGGSWFPPIRWLRDALSTIPELDAGDGDQEPFPLATLPSRTGESRALMAGTIICFEIVFPARCRAWRQRGARVLLNSANYGWFGTSFLRTQIQAIARLRAAETATTIVMAGNTGPTCFFDPVGGRYGTFHPADDPEKEEPAGALETTHREGWATATLWSDPTVTPYVRWGDACWAVWGVALLGLALARGRRSQAPSAHRAPSHGVEPAAEDSAATDPAPGGSMDEIV
jgi:apolipoprotein N-acyltransferase